MRARMITLCLVAFLLAGSVAGAQASSPPEAWMVYEEGNRLFEQREYGLALQRYKEAVARAGILPEAEAAIGDVYRAEGELDLALGQYEKAYNHRNSLVVPGQRYEILYRKAAIYRDQELYKLMEDTLVKILEDDTNWSGGKNARLRTQVEANFYARGIDQVLRLYRFKPSFASRAHSELGWFYYRTGRFPLAALHSLYGVIYAASEIAGFQRERDIEWEFDTLAALLGSVEGSRELTRFAVQSGLAKDMYYLAGSAWAAMYPKLATGLWSMLAKWGIAGEYAALSTRQLQKPWIEP
jgi:tetratricopeptide (TPR) repeat protein